MSQSNQSFRQKAEYLIASIFRINDQKVGYERNVLEIFVRVIKLDEVKSPNDHAHYDDQSRNEK